VLFLTIEIATLTIKRNCMALRARAKARSNSNANVKTSLVRKGVGGQHRPSEQYLNATKPLVALLLQASKPATDETASFVAA